MKKPLWWIPRIGYPQGNVVSAKPRKAFNSVDRIQPFQQVNPINNSFKKKKKKLNGDIARFGHQILSGAPCTQQVMSRGMAALTPRYHTGSVSSGLPHLMFRPLLSPRPPLRDTRRKRRRRRRRRKVAVPLRGARWGPRYQQPPGAQVRAVGGAGGGEGDGGEGSPRFTSSLRAPGRAGGSWVEEAGVSQGQGEAGRRGMAAPARRRGSSRGERRHHAGGRRGRSGAGKAPAARRGPACWGRGAAPQGFAERGVGGLWFLCFFLGGGGRPLPGGPGGSAGFRVPPHRGAGGVPEGGSRRPPVPHPPAQHRALGGR